MPIEIPRGLPFSVDTWCPVSKKKRHHFLTHAHKDHTTGISTHYSYPIYCTHLTKTLLQQFQPQACLYDCQFCLISWMYPFDFPSFSLFLFLGLFIFLCFCSLVILCLCVLRWGNRFLLMTLMEFSPLRLSTPITALVSNLAFIDSNEFSFLCYLIIAFFVRIFWAC